MPIIGIIFGDGMLVHYEIFFGKLLSQILEQVIHRPAIVHIINLTTTNREKIIREILAEDLDALLWEGPVIEADAIAELRAHGLPVISMKSAPSPGCDCVYFDMDTLGAEIAKRLLRKKRKNVVFLADRYPWNAAKKALVATFAEAGISLNEKLFLNSCSSSLEKLKEFLELGVPIDAVINPLFQIRHVIRVFDSLGFDRGKNCTLVNTGIYQENLSPAGGILYELPFREYVAAAVERVFQLIENKNLEPVQIPIPVPISES